LVEDRRPRKSSATPRADDPIGEPGEPDATATVEPEPRLPQIGDLVTLWFVDRPMGGGPVIRTGVPARIVAVAHEDDPHSVLNLEFDFEVRHDQIPPARPEFYGSINQLRFSWTLVDEDGVLVRDPNSEPMPAIDAANVVLWWPDPQGYDVPLPARIEDDRDFPHLDLVVEETEVVHGVSYGRGDRSWSWPAEPAEGPAG
jgi:hypothetical protein